MAAARIMHVDNALEVREVVRQSLEIDPELTVLSCASGAEALAAARECPPDLMLLDDAIPGMDGLTILAKLHLDRHTAAIPVVFMSARAHARELAHLQSLGVAGVVAKPFDATTLVEAVRKFLRPKPTGHEAMREAFLIRAEGFASELSDCVIALAKGADRFDELVHVRQIANELVDTAAASGYRVISAAASLLDETNCRRPR